MFVSKSHGLLHPGMNPVPWILPGIAERHLFIRYFDDMKFLLRFSHPVPIYIIRKRVMHGLFVFAIVLTSGRGVSAQTWQHVIDYVPDSVNVYHNPLEILPMADGGFMTVLINGYMVRFDADGDTVWTNSLPDSLEFIYLIDAKVDPNGKVSLMAKRIGGDTVFNRLITLNNFGEIETILTLEARYEDFCATGDGFLLLGSTEVPDTTLRLLRIDLAGDTVWYQQYICPPNHTMWYGYDVIKSMDGGFIAASYEQPQPPGDITLRQRVLKTDANGVIQWTSIAPKLRFIHEIEGQLLEEPDGSIVLMGNEKQSAAFYAIRLSASGQTLLEKTNFTYYAPRDFALTADGGFWAVGTELSGGLNTFYIRKLNHDFTVAWKRLFATSVFGTFGYRIADTGNNYFGVLGGVYYNDEDYYPYVIHPDSMGNVEQSLIAGRIRHDADDDCVADSSEQGLANWLVSTGIYYTLTDSLGRFEMYGGVGITPVHVFPPMAYWDVCPGFDTVTFSQPGDTAYLSIPVFSEVDCPFNEINIAVAAFRPCFESTMNVQFCNIGTVPADSATALVVLPPEIDFISASMPVAQQSGDSLWFDLDTLDIGDCGSFNVTVLVDCDSAITGQTLCVEARIFPDTLCYPANNWSGAEVKVTAQCINNQEVKLTVRNIGDAPTTPTLNYLIIEDQVVLHQGPFQLDPDEFLEFSEPANGAFWRISADQEPNFPTPSAPAAWVEGCGGFQGAGYANNYYFDDAASSVDIECRVVTNSFDPNDKQATPGGYGAEHFIEPGTELTYLIRFQNTGTDTAFNVILRDTLDVWLDVASVRPGASSHPYTFEIAGTGILKIWFKNILLPDSNANEAASHGFFQYRVKLKPDVPLGTQIFNRAAIYFDFNAPVITNQTFHTVGKDFYTVSIKDVSSEPGVSLTVTPNPFRETARLSVENAGAGSFELLLYDVYGGLVRREPFDGPEMELRRSGLSAGLYSFELRQDGRRIASGKMVVL